MTTYVNDDAYPFITVAYIASRFGEHWISGSGVLVGRNDVLTASHVIYNINYGPADEVRVYFSFDPSENNSYYNAVYENYYTDFDPDGDGDSITGDGRPSSLAGSELDIALLTLSTAVGDTMGWMGMDFSFTSGNVNVTGHPDLYSLYMVNDFGFVKHDYVDNVLDISSLEINPGNSGGPIWYDYGSGPYVVGVVSSDYAASSLAAHAQWLKDLISDNDKFITSGSGGASTEYGTDGNDLFTAATYIDTYLGFAGLDTIKFSGTRSQYHLSMNSEGDGTVEDASTQVTWSLSGIERVSFLNGTLAFDFSGNAGEGYRLYQAAFDRTPDTGGLSYWVDILDRGHSLHAVAKQFIKSDEFHSLYGEQPSNADLVELLYENVLNRAPDPGGYDYWLGKMDDGLSQADMLIAFSESDENQANVWPAVQDGIWLV